MGHTFSYHSNLEFRTGKRLRNTVYFSRVILSTASLPENCPVSTDMRGGRAPLLTAPRWANSSLESWSLSCIRDALINYPDPSSLGQCLWPSQGLFLSSPIGGCYSVATSTAPSLVYETDKGDVAELDAVALTQHPCTQHTAWFFISNHYNCC